MTWSSGDLHNYLLPLPFIALNLGMLLQFITDLHNYQSAIIFFYSIYCNLSFVILKEPSGY